MDVLAYLRVSTDKQETNRQMREIRNWCKHEDLFLARTYGEVDALSGRSRAVRHSPKRALNYYRRLIEGDYDVLQRPQLAELLRSIRRSPTIGAVVFYALDRLSRDTIELLLLDLILKNHGVKMILVSQGGLFYTDTASGKLMLRILAVHAESECDLASERTKSKLALLGEEHGKDYCTTPPAGWTKNESVYYKNPEKWDKVAHCYRLHKAKFSNRNIMKMTGIERRLVAAYIRAYKFIPPVFTNMGDDYEERRQAAEKANSNMH